MPRTFSVTISSRHVLAIVVAIALGAVLLPISVEAATGSAVNITDPLSSSNKAHVTGAGTLQSSLCSYNSTASGHCALINGYKVMVGDGAGPLTVDGTVSVDGSIVFASPFPPLSPLSSTPEVSDTSQNSTLRSTPFPASTFVEVTSVTFASLSGSAVNLSVVGHEPSGNSCTGTGSGFTTVVVAAVPAGQTVHTSFPAPVEVTDSQPFCIDVSPFGTPPASFDVAVTIVGYLT